MGEIRETPVSHLITLELVRHIPRRRIVGKKSETPNLSRRYLKCHGFMWISNDPDLLDPADPVLRCNIADLSLGNGCRRLDKESLLLRRK